MDEIHVVRHKVLEEGRTQQAVAREGLARVTVCKYVEQAAPTRKAEAGPRARPVWDVVGERMQAVLAEPVTTHEATRARRANAAKLLSLASRRNITRFFHPLRLCPSGSARPRTPR